MRREQTEAEQDAEAEAIVQRILASRRASRLTGEPEISGAQWMPMNTSIEVRKKVLLHEDLKEIMAEFYARRIAEGKAMKATYVPLSERSEGEKLIYHFLHPR